MPARNHAPAARRRARHRRRLAPFAVILAALAIAGVMGVFVGGGSPAGASATPPTARRVLLIAVPRLSWARLQHADAPNLRSLFEHGTVSSLSIKAVGSVTSIEEGYATLGAGNRSGVGSGGDAAFNRAEQVSGGSAGQLYLRSTGKRPTGEIVVPGIKTVNASDKKLLFGAQPGLLGETLTTSGWHTAVIGNADDALPGMPSGTPPVIAPPGSGVSGASQALPAASAASGDSLDFTTIHRTAALSLMDRSGQLPAGDVSTDLLMRDARYSDGLRLEPSSVGAAFAGAWRDHTAVTVELSDVERADSQVALAGAGRTNVLAEQALKADDAIIGRLLSNVDYSRDLVMVVAPAAPRSQEQLTPFAIRGPGFGPGVADSGTTRRAGYVTLTDVAPTILDSTGIKVPTHMNGATIRVADHRDPVSAQPSLAAANQVAIFHRSVLGKLNSLWSSILFGGVIAGVLLLALGRWAPHTLRSLQWLVELCRIVLLAMIAYAILAFVSGLFRYDKLGHPGYTAFLVLGSFAVAIVVELASRLIARRNKDVQVVLAPVALAAILLTLLVVDLITGARMQINTVFGYSAIGAGRFAGYGNQAYSFLVASAVVVVCGVWAMASRRAGAADATDRAVAGSSATAPWRPRGAWHNAPRTTLLLGFVAAVFLIVIVWDGLPSLGSDVGGALTTLPTAALVLVLLAGYKVTWRRVVAVCAATLGLVVVFTAIDLARPPSQRTHLGRLASSVINGGDSMGALTIERKLHSSLATFGTSWLAPTLGVIVALAIIALLRPLRTVDRRVPGVWASVWGIVVVGVLAAAFNDSGVEMPATMAGVYLPFLLYLLLHLDAERLDAGEGVVADGKSEHVPIPATTSP